MKKNCPKCDDGVGECVCGLSPSWKPAPARTQEPQHDVVRQTQYPLHYRLTRGFAILSGRSDV